MKRILAKAGVVLGSVALATTGAVVTAAPANAAWSCPSGALCAYTAPDGDSAYGDVYADNSDLLRFTKFDNAESLRNNGNNCNVRVYSGLNYTGSSFVIPRGYYVPTLANTVYWHNVASNDWCV
ncbi:peptidase inhibitor family I36 protein [Streptomyces sp. NPDC096132]|uniref:peptidase inhibitor family I36 protein n=1 Tax=Streptomyces sp. NPDC096132 TaxID=3366075 RepID=UPI0037F481FE